MVQKGPGFCDEDTSYSSISRRSCLDCGQVRIDKEYV